MPMTAWLRALADRIMGRTGKPSRPDAAPSMATPPADPADPIDELKRIIGPNDVPPQAARRARDGSRRKGPRRR
jgi:hypothetical protein